MRPSNTRKAAPDEVIGAIAVRRIEARQFTERQIALLQTFADQAIIAIENVGLFKELHARNLELTQALDRETATGEILLTISNSPTSVKPVFEAILANGTPLYQATIGPLFLVEDNMLRLIADRGAPSALPTPGASRTEPDPTRGSAAR